MRSLCRVASCAGAALGLVLVPFLLSGCGQQPGTHVANPLLKQGAVHGGQQPVSGSTIQLYAVGTTGDGSAATPLLTSPVVSDAYGNFTLTGDYTCPSASSLVYLVATGGNPGLPAATNNAALALMAALGQCGSLSSSTFINVNELTTVAAVWALAPYMSSYSAIGSSTSDASALTSAFALAAVFANTSTGTVPGLNVPAGATVPVAQIDTIADILAACVNSAGGVAGDGSPCGTLLGAATPSGGTAPANVIAAAINIANNPTFNVASLFALVTPIAPFQPVVTSVPADYTVQLSLPSALSISPGVVTFPNTILAIQSMPETVTLSNTGGSAIPIYAFTISGSNASDFTQVNNCTGSLAAGESCSVQVTFTPSIVGNRNAFLNIADGSPNPTTSIALTGSGTTNAGGQAGPVSLSPSSLTFSQVGVSQSVTLSNFGLIPLTIQSVNLSAGYSQTNNCGNTLSAQSTCTFFLTLNDVSSGPTGALVVFDDATNGSQTVSLNVPITNGQPATGNTTTTPLFFGAENVGTISSSLAYFGYSGSHGLTSMTGTITGTNASDFIFVGSNFCSSLSTGCSIYVAFKPTAAGYRTATLSTNYGSVTLNGVGNPGGAAGFILSPPLVSLTSGISGVVTVANIGGTTLNLSETVEGLDPSDFIYSPGVAATACGATLASGQACGLSVLISSLAMVVGTRAATLTVTDTASGVHHSVSLTGTASYLAPTISTYSLLWYFDTQVGSQSAPQTAFATAPAGHALTMQMVPATSALELTSPTYCAGGGSCPITVVFRPTSADQFVESHVVVTDTTTGKTASLVVDGFGGIPVATLSSTTLQFASRTVGSASTPLIVTLTNTGTGGLRIPGSGVSLMGTNASDFQESTTCLPSLNGGLFDINQSCTVTVTFTPLASGTRTAYIQILSNAASSPDIISLSGTGN